MSISWVTSNHQDRGVAARFAGQAQMGVQPLPLSFMSPAPRSAHRPQAVLAHSCRLDVRFREQGGALLSERVERDRVVPRACCAALAMADEVLRNIYLNQRVLFGVVQGPGSGLI